MRDDRSGTLDGRGSRTLGRIACVALFALALMPAGANGAVAGQSFGGEGPGALVYAADPGEANRLTISREDSRIVFSDTGAAIRPGRGCAADTPSRVSCDQQRSIDVRLEDGDDEASSTGDVSEGGRTSIALSGDQGDDTLRGSADVSSLDGGAGRDVLAGGAGTTFIQAADVLWFAEFGALPALAPARDEVTCAAPNPGALPTDVDVGPDDVVSGPCGPVATYGTDVTDVRGTEGPDRIGDRIGPTRIEALGGDDIVQGGERADGGPGNDRMFGTGLQLGGPGDDRMDVGAHGTERGRIAGQDGDDFITGSDGPDSLSGGAGRDRISGRGGNDTIRVRDGERDVVRCGDGHDTVLADRIDTIGRDCERTSRTASAVTASQPVSARAASGGAGPTRTAPRSSRARRTASSSRNVARCTDASSRWGARTRSRTRAVAGTSAAPPRPGCPAATWPSPRSARPSATSLTASMSTTFGSPRSSSASAAMETSRQSLSSATARSDGSTARRSSPCPNGKCTRRPMANTRETCCSPAGPG